MATPTLLKRLHGLAEAAAFLGVLFTIAGLASRYACFLEYFAHLKVQLALCFLIYAGIELVARRRGCAIISLIFAAINALPVLLLLMPTGTQVKPDTPLSARLRILQANILTSNTNATALLALVARECPDVIVLQEPNARWLNALSELTNSYPVFAALPREDNFGAAIYCTSNALSAEIFLLSDPERAPSSLARIAVGNKILTVVGTHTLAPCNDAMWRGRNRFMLEFANTLRGIRGPLVVTGDFNNTPWSPHFRDFINDSGLLDSAQGCWLQPTWPTCFIPLARIPLDHCLHSTDALILDRRTGPDIGSDHLPLIIDIAF